MTEKVPSESDARTANNAVRHQYRVLSDDEKAAMVEVKDKGAEFIELLQRIGGTAGQTNHSGEPLMGSAHLHLAFRHVEDAVYRAVKHITK